MKAILCTEWGGPEKLRVGDVAPPSPGPGEVAIDVKAAGVNFADTVIIQGAYQLKPDFPFVPGLEVAGTVAELGEGVDALSTGDRVVGIPNIGAFAERVVVKAVAVVPIPDAMDFETAASFAVAYSTSHMALGYRAGLKAGETLMVFGAAGGVGLTVVEIGKIMGAEVIACAGTREKLDLCAARGADHVIDYGEEDIRERVREITGGKGADVIYDPVGGSAFDAAMRSIAWEGRIVVIGFASGFQPGADQHPAGQEHPGHGFLLGFVFRASAVGHRRLHDRADPHVAGRPAQAPYQPCSATGASW